MILGNLLSIFMEILPSRDVTYYSVPYHSVSTYAERKTISSKIADALIRRSPYADNSHALIIYGSGGMGKSQLVLKYLESHREQFNAIFWIDAESKQTTVTSFERCARALGISNNDAISQPSSVHELPIIEKVYQWLEEFGRLGEPSLMVFDNVDDFEWGIKKIISRCSNGSIIITSRDKYSKMLFDGKCKVIEVGCLEISESRAILFNRLDFETERASDIVTRNCESLAKKLGNLALAVDLAGAYISNEDDKVTALEEYVNGFDQQKDYLLELSQFKGLLPTDMTVYTVWDKTFHKLKELYPSLKPELVLTFLAHFRGAIIHHELFVLAIKHANEAAHIYHKMANYSFERCVSRCPDSWKYLDYTKSFKPLLRYGLLQEVKGNWKGVTMHSLVRWRAMRIPQCHPWELWYLEFMICVALAHFDEFDEFTFTREIASQIPETGFCIRILANGWASILTMMLFSKVYEDCSRYKEAIAYCEEAITLHEKIGAADDFLPTLECRVCLGRMLYIQRQYDNAERELLEVIRVEPSPWNVSDFESIGGHEILAAAYREQGFYELAEKLLSDTIERRTSLLGPDHFAVIKAKQQIVRLLGIQGKLSHLEFPISDLQVGVRDQYTRDLYQAAAYMTSGQIPEALAHLSKMWNIIVERQGYSGEDRTFIGDSIAFCYARESRIQEAEEKQKSVLDYTLRNLGPDHIWTLRCKKTFVLIYWFQGQLKKATELVDEIADQEEKMIGTCSADVLQMYDTLEKTAANHQKYREVVSLIDKFSQSINDKTFFSLRLWKLPNDEKEKGPAAKELSE